jgi:2-dehydropantoate 2-reductase
MKILIIGKGVIGSIYAHQFMKNGFEVHHYIRQINDDLPSSIQIDILDNAINKVEVETYTYKFTDRLTSDYDLVIVSVRHYQLLPLLEKISTLNIPILVFGNVWTELSTIKSLFKKPENIYFGMPRAGGAIFNNKLVGAIMHEIILEERNLERTYNQIVLLFEKSGRKIVSQKSMQDWYWTHFATTVAWICGGVKAKGFIPFSKSYTAIKNSINVGKEAIEIVKARGANITVCSDINPFLLPAWISALIAKTILVKEETIRISAGHGDYAPTEMTKIYEDIVIKGKELKCKTTLLENYKKYFDVMNENTSH